METRVRLNGTETIRFPTNDMLFGVARFISTMTRYLTSIRAMSSGWAPTGRHLTSSLAMWWRSRSLGSGC